MADSTTIALASIGASAFVGLGAPVVAQLFARSRDGTTRTHELEKQRRDLEAERTRADVAELRALLDDAAQNIARAMELFFEMRSLFVSLGAKVTDQTRGAGARFIAARCQVDVDRARVALRMGADHPLTVAHKAVSQAMTEVSQYVWIAQSEGDGADLKEPWEVIKQSADELYQARDRFTAEAVALVGARTGSVEAAAVEHA